MARYLFLSAENPTPPRNGVTIPIYNHIEILRGLGATVEVAVLASGKIEESPNSNKNPHLIAVTPRGRIRSALGELLFSTPYFKKSANTKDIVTLIRNGEIYEYIYYSPISMYHIANQACDAHEMHFGTRPKIIAAISDTYTSVLRSGFTSTGSTRNLTSLIKFIRSFYFLRIERKILSPARAILVQTKKDREWLMNLVGVSEEKIKIMTNGVDSALFNIPPTQENSLVFVGNLKSKYYLEKLKWFHEHVWESQEIKKLNAVLYVYSSGANCGELRKIIKNDKSIIIVDHFVENICDVYANKAICIAPIFKDYGFINKVAEAMASGLVVVGDRSAFNGIHDVVDGEHVMIASDPKEFIFAVSSLLKNRANSTRIGSNARQLAIRQFSWTSRRQIFKDI